MGGMKRQYTPKAINLKRLIKYLNKNNGNNKKNK